MLVSVGCGTALLLLSLLLLLLCSGGTQEYPALLQYSCDLQTNVMPVSPMQVTLPASPQQQQQQQQRSKQKPQQHPEVLDLLLNGKPLMCLAFSDMVVSQWESEFAGLLSLAQRGWERLAGRTHRGRVAGGTNSKHAPPAFCTDCGHLLCCCRPAAAFSQMRVEEPQRLQLPAAQHSAPAMQPAFAALVPGAANSSSSKY